MQKNEGLQYASISTNEYLTSQKRATNAKLDGCWMIPAILDRHQKLKTCMARGVCCEVYDIFPLQKWLVTQGSMLAFEATPLCIPEPAGNLSPGYE